MKLSSHCNFCILKNFENEELDHIQKIVFWINELNGSLLRTLAFVSKVQPIKLLKNKKSSISMKSDNLLQLHFSNCWISWFNSVQSLLEKETISSFIIFKISSLLNWKHNYNRFRKLKAQKLPERETIIHFCGKWRFYLITCIASFFFCSAIFCKARNLFFRIWILFAM